MSRGAAEFDSMFTANPDPWAFETRWYEARKRDLTLASLPRHRYERAYEPGCANGVLTASLASRCERLLATDGSPRAVDLARARLASVGHVDVRHAWVPDEWPDGRFDLVVVSELGYFLDAGSMRRLAGCVGRSLTDDGTLLACHWRWKSSDCDLDGAAVHSILQEALALPVLLSMQDKDFLLTVWCRDPRSVAQREGLFAAG